MWAAPWRRCRWRWGQGGGGASWWGEGGGGKVEQLCAAESFGWTCSDRDHTYFFDTVRSLKTHRVSLCTLSVGKLFTARAGELGPAVMKLFTQFPQDGAWYMMIQLIRLIQCHGSSPNLSQLAHLLSFLSLFKLPRFSIYRKAKWCWWWWYLKVWWGKLEEKMQWSPYSGEPWLPQTCCDWDHKWPHHHHHQWW